VKCGARLTKLPKPGYRPNTKKTRPNTTRKKSLMKRSMAKSKERKRKSAKRRNDLACFDFLIKGSYE